MASKAWYKPSALPRLIARFEYPPPPSPSPSPSPSPPSSSATPPPPPPPPPGLCATRRRKKAAIEVWTTTCIVTNFGKKKTASSASSASASASTTDPLLLLPRCKYALINPGNPYLTGPHTFPYFPRGGPQPEKYPDRQAHHIMGYVTQWGGMDVGGGMMFAAETIDGLVHQHGGTRLRAECSLVPAHRHARAYADQQRTTDAAAETTTTTTTTGGGPAKCPVGTAVTTSPGGHDLRTNYDYVVHTTPPFYDHPPTRTEDLGRALDIIIIDGEEEEEEALSSSSSSAAESDDASRRRRRRHRWSRELLRSCYRQSFREAFGDDDDDNSRRSEDGRRTLVGYLRDAMGMMFGSSSSSDEERTGRRRSSRRGRIRAAVPLLGAGCRAFPRDVALEVAASEGASWLLSESSAAAAANGGGHERLLSRGGMMPEEGRDEENEKEEEEEDVTVVFGLLETSDAEALSERIEQKLYNR